MVHWSMGKRRRTSNNNNNNSQHKKKSFGSFEMIPRIRFCEMPHPRATAAGMWDTFGDSHIAHKHKQGTRYMIIYIAHGKRAAYYTCLENTTTPRVRSMTETVVGHHLHHTHTHTLYTQRTHRSHASEYIDQDLTMRSFSYRIKHKRRQRAIHAKAFQ